MFAPSFLTPEFGCSSFPMKSAHYSAPSIPRCKRVRFAPNLTDEYEIPSRTCQQELCTSTEEMLNRVHRLRRSLSIERTTVAHLVDVAYHIACETDQLLKQYEDDAAFLPIRKRVVSLQTQAKYIDDKIFGMKMSTLQTKGLCEKLIKTRERLNRERLSDVILGSSEPKLVTKENHLIKDLRRHEECCFVKNISRESSSKAIICPMPLFTTNMAA